MIPSPYATLRAASQLSIKKKSEFFPHYIRFTVISELSGGANNQVVDEILSIYAISYQEYGLDLLVSSHNHSDGLFQLFRWYGLQLNWLMRWYVYLYLTEVAGSIPRQGVFSIRILLRNLLHRGC